MALQFACIAHKPNQKKKKNIGNTVVLEAVTRREQSLALFHLLGKVLYNKRPFVPPLSPCNIATNCGLVSGKDDPPNPSASAKDLQKERDLDVLLKDPLKLPPHLEHHERRVSRVDVDVRKTSFIIFYTHILLKKSRRCTQIRRSTPLYSLFTSTRIIPSSVMKSKRLKV